MRPLSKICLVISLCWISNPVFSQSTKLNSDVMATVNGVPIRQSVLEQAMRQAVSQGLKDTPELRQQQKKNIIEQEIFAQEVMRLNLDKSDKAQYELHRIKQNYLMSLWVEQANEKIKISDAEIKKEYQRQLILLGGDQASQFKFSQIKLGSKEAAQQVIARINKGEAFDLLAKDKRVNQLTSTNATEWVLLTQMHPVAAAVLSNIPKGSVTQNPVEINGASYVLRLDDKRPFKVPSLEDSKKRIKENLMAQKRREAAQELIKKSSIVE